MDYYCEICFKNIKAKNKYKHFKSESHKKFDKCKQKILSLKDIDIKNADETLSLYIIGHNRNFDCYLVKCEYKLVFSGYQYCPYITSKLFDNKRNRQISEKRNSDFEDIGYTFNHIAEMHTITLANKLDMTHDFYIKHIMCALEWKINAMIDKDKSLINKLIVIGDIL